MFFEVLGVIWRVDRASNQRRRVFSSRLKLGAPAWTRPKLAKSWVLSFVTLLAICLPAHAADRPLVAVVDGGVARTAELKDVLVAEYDFAASPPRPEFQPQFDHGTHVATVLHRAARGGVDIVSMRIDDPAECPGPLNPPCQPNAEPIAAAIYKAVDLGAAAINVSLSLKTDPAIQEAVRHAASQGVRVVLAAGNNGAEHPGNLAAAIAGHPNTILVGALDAFGQPWMKSNKPDQGSGVDYNFVWRPGVDVATVGADGSPARASGTSLAAPMETAFILAGPELSAQAPMVEVVAPAPVDATPTPLDADTTTASSAVRSGIFAEFDTRMLLHVLCGFALAVALLPLVLMWAESTRQ